MPNSKTFLSFYLVYLVLIYFIRQSTSNPNNNPLKYYDESPYTVNNIAMNLYQMGYHYNATVFFDRPQKLKKSESNLFYRIWEVGNPAKLTEQNYIPSNARSFKIGPLKLSTRYFIRIFTLLPLYGINERLSTLRFFHISTPAKNYYSPYEIIITKGYEFAKKFEMTTQKLDRPYGISNINYVTYRLTLNFIPSNNDNTIQYLLVRLYKGFMVVHEKWLQKPFYAYSFDLKHLLLEDVMYEVEVITVYSNHNYVATEFSYRIIFEIN